MGRAVGLQNVSFVLDTWIDKQKEKITAGFDKQTAYWFSFGLLSYNNMIYNVLICLYHYSVSFTNKLPPTFELFLVIVRLCSHCS